MFRYEHRIRFAEVDAAGVMFFSRLFEHCHAALEGLLDELPGGAAVLVRDRDLGTPTVHLRADYRAPLRYGDVAVIDLDVQRIGRSSVHLRYRVTRRGDDERAATVEHVIVTARMSCFATVPVPDDLRGVFARHLAADPADARA